MVGTVLMQLPQIGEARRGTKNPGPYQGQGRAERAAQGHIVARPQPPSTKAENAIKAGDLAGSHASA